MSLNMGINATIALIENRPEQFKEMLRGQQSDVNDISAVRVRLNKALNFFAATKIRYALMETLHIDPERRIQVQLSEREREVFFLGVRAAEEVFEQLVNDLENQ